MTDRDSNKPLATSRRNFLKQSIALAGAVSGIAAFGLSAPASLRSAAWAAGSDAPEKAALTVGFIPRLTALRWWSPPPRVSARNTA